MKVKLFLKVMRSFRCLVILIKNLDKQELGEYHQIGLKINYYLLLKKYANMNDRDMLINNENYVILKPEFFQNA